MITSPKGPSTWSLVTTWRPLLLILLTILNLILPDFLLRFFEIFYPEYYNSFSQMDFEHEHAKGAGGICPGCRKMEEPKLVSCQILLLTLLILPHHNLAA